LAETIDNLTTHRMLEILCDRSHADADAAHPGLDGRKMSKSYGNAIGPERKRRRHSRQTKVMVPTRRASGVAILEIRRVSGLRLAETVLASETLKWSAEAAAPRHRLHRVQSAMADNLIKVEAPIRGVA